MIERLPEGLDTQLGRWFVGGQELSGGQWQKVALARLFMRSDADLLVLDEPTSAMDAEAEASVREAIKVGAAAVVSGGIDDQDLKELLGRDLGVAITGSETIGLTVIVTEGFGDIAMASRTWRLLADKAGRRASVNGATQIRAGVMRPEILVPLDPGENEGDVDPTVAHEAGVLEKDRFDYVGDVLS